MDKKINTTSLNALRYFEVAARHLHLTKAAEELYVTYSAVSHQIRSLEDNLGVLLFDRSKKPLRLTREGKRLYKTLSAAFHDIDRVAGDLADTEFKGEFYISCAPSLAVKWLIPALSDFIEKFPSLQIHVSSVLQLTGHNQPADLAICYGEPKEIPGWRIAATAYANLTPVGSPDFVQQNNIMSPADLLDYPLLHEDDGAFWKRWLTSAGVELQATPSGLFFDQAHMALEATMAGYGIGIIDTILGKNDILAGHLVRLFEHTVPMLYPYYLIAPDEHKMTEPAKEMESIIRSEFKKWCLLTP
nr:LysR substrate-binding domain-containing protein [uncultured Desulfobacter sp.]